jgi:beta-glucosidase
MKSAINQSPFLSTRVLLLSVFLYLGLIFSPIVADGQAPKAPLYKDPKQAVDARVEDLLKRMNLDEKIAQLLGLWSKKATLLDKKGNLDPDSAAVHLKYGIGQIARPGEGIEGNGGNGRNAEENAKFVNAIQTWLLASTRLGIPAIMHEECLHGQASKDATSFSQPIGLGSTWNRELVEALFTMTANEVRSRGAHMALTPVVDVARDPRWGRVEETYGEDPYLVGEMGLAAVNGFQGRNGALGPNRVMATLKHFAAHGQPESGNNIAPTNYSERILREIFLYPFRRSVVDGKASGIMASYNEIDGVPSHGNAWLLDKILRKEWGFKGIVVSDYYGIEELNRRHAVAADYVEAGAKSLKAGVDLELPDPYTYPMLKQALQRGMITTADIDKSVRRILRQKFAMGLFENVLVDPEVAKVTVGSADHALLALKGAEETMILLKNDGNVAPIDVKKYKTIAVIGPNADRELLGGYSDHPKYVISVLQGIREKVGDQAKILYAEGCRVTEPGSWYKDQVTLTDPASERPRMAEALEIAKQADIVILAIGGNELLSREAWAEGHLGDRSNLDLMGVQNELIDQLSALGKPIVALLFNGSPLAAGNLKAKVPTIFECWYLGQETGRAVANVVFGDVSPSGKLPITIPRSVGHLPVYYNYKPTARRGYLFDDLTPLWSFGYGLSYTTFQFGKPILDKAAIAKNENATLSISVTNTGNRKAKEVVQLYIRDKVSSVTRPVKELKGFEKIELAPGETKVVQFKIGFNQLAFYDDKMQFSLESGDFDLMVGNSSLNADLQKIMLKVK